MGLDYRFELATPEDDSQIRRLLRDNPVPGQMALTYEREPEYALGTSVMGHNCQTLVARHEESNQVVAVATRSIRSLFVNGQVQEVGYIGQLRVDPAHQGRWLLSQGFRHLYELHQDRATRGYITTIINGNTLAEAILVHKARRTFPVYRPMACLYTCAMIIGRPPPARLLRLATREVEIRRGDTVDEKELLTFLQECGRQRQFFPAYRMEDFAGPATRNFSIADFCVVCRGGKIAGVAGLWDQSSYKQTIVRAYSRALHRIRPLYNGMVSLLGAQPLTVIDHPIRYAYASFFCVANDDPVVGNHLLNSLHDCAFQRGFAFLMVGLTERDRLLPLVRRRLHFPYRSTLYTVCWPEDEAWREELDGRIPYVEIATL